MGSPSEPERAPAPETDLAAFSRELAEVLSEWSPGGAVEVQALVDKFLSDAGQQAGEELMTRVATTGQDWSYSPPDPLGRQLSRIVMSMILKEGSGIDGVDSLGKLADKPAVLVGNHLSYIDVNVLDYLISLTEYEASTRTLTTLVGPKVFTELTRRVASLCFGTIKLPQSRSRASGEAVMNAREVAGLAPRVIEASAQRLALGDHLLVFPEGARTRASGLQRCLAAVARYLTREDAYLLAFAQTGCEALFPVDSERVHPARVQARLGRPIPIRDLLDACGRRRQRVADVIGFLIADLLPSDYRGVYRETSDELREARAIAQALSP